MAAPLPHSEPPARVLRAAWAVPVAGTPIRNAEIVLRKGRIAAIGPARGRSVAGAETVDLGSTVLLPGLVNAHAHLEFSDLPQPLGEPGMTLPEWIGQVFRYRADPGRPPQAERIVRGLLESAARGTTLLADILTAAEAPDEPRGPRAVYFRELIGLTDETVADCRRSAEDWLSARPADGLSPHAPYTVRGDLLDALIRTSADRGTPLMMHLAETRVELHLLREGGGPFAELLHARGLPAADLFHGGTRPLDILRRLAEASRAVVVHGNYLERDELEFLAARADRMALVFCPRTHARFGHPRHPIVEALRLGVRCCLGTDGRGTAPDLSLLAEMRQLAAEYGEIAPEKILSLGTLAGAESLGLAADTGSLTVGKRADLIALDASGQDADDPMAAILHGTGEPSAVLRGGMVIHSTLPRLPVDPVRP